MGNLQSAEPVTERSGVEVWNDALFKVVRKDDTWEIRVNSNTEWLMFAV